MQDDEVVRDRFTKWVAACFRITQMLEVDDVLQALIDEARSITGAAFGALVTFDEAGHTEGLVTSGFTPEQLQHLRELPGGRELNAHLQQIQEPARIDDLHDYAKSLGLPELDQLITDFLGTPLIHLGKRLGNIFLGEKLGGRGFTLEDEESVIWLAAHAAVVVTNARMYREERRAKAELESLIESSPLGVLVFDAKTGDLVTVNDEARRIVGGLGGRGRSLGALLQELTFRRLDGRQIGLDELPLTKALSSGETVRAEELVISRPDGQTVSILVNARPIRSEDGAIVSVINTIQDLAPLEETERQRAEFLGMVSDGLRTPLATVKGATATVLGSSSQMDAVEMLYYFRLIDEQVDHLRSLASDLLDLTRIELGKLSLTTETAVLLDVIDRAVSAFQSGGTNDVIKVDLPGELPPIAADAQRLVQVFFNLFTDAAKHSLEGSTTRVSALHANSHITVDVAFLGSSESDERLPHLFSKFYFMGQGDQRPGIGDTGLGLAVCKGIVEAQGGRIWAETEGPGGVTRFVFTVPVAVEEEATDAEVIDPDQRSTQRSRAPRGLTTVLLVINNTLTLRNVRNTLLGDGYSPLVARAPEDADHLIETEQPNVILLDASLFRVEGPGLFEHLAATTNARIILLTDRDSEQDLAVALEKGAFDYIANPFSSAELLARVNMASRWRPAFGQPTPLGIYQLHDLTVDYAGRTVTVGGQRVRLTATEYELLFQLSTNGGRVLTHEQLLQRVWGQDYSGGSQVLRTYVKYLRNKLGDNAKNPKYILTEPRIGYRMARADVPTYQRTAGSHGNE